MPDNNWNIANKLYNRYTYDQMLFSFKPLRLENWYTDEEITILKGTKHE